MLWKASVFTFVDFMGWSPQNIFIKDFTYHLPQERIAAFPLEKRDDSKLLVYRDGLIVDDRFFNLDGYIFSNCLLVLNDTRVIEARIFFQKITGAVVEIFCLEPYNQNIETSLAEKRSSTWRCLIGGASKWKHGQILSKEIESDGSVIALNAKYIAKEADSFVIEFNWTPSEMSFAEVLHASGAIPLPPYIKRQAEAVDKERYQTVFGIHEGSVAAPTAALHFTEDIFRKLAAKGIKKEFVTLHVGAGTFKPVKTETIAEHEMHNESFTVTKAALQEILNAPSVVAVGTTSSRTLESIHWLAVKHMSTRSVNEWQLSQWECYSLSREMTYRESYAHLIEWMEANDVEQLHCKTSLIIVPGYSFKVAEGLITNFHQPQSTLLLLVAAFIGDDWRRIYEHALKNNYRFLSYGDSSLLWRNL